MVTQPLPLAFSILAGADDSLLPPKRASKGAAGYDIAANLPGKTRTSLTIEPGARALIPTGFSLILPMDTEAQIRPRSGLAYKYGLTIPNSPGTIDSDYRGEIKVLLHNLGSDPVTITHGMRIAQMVICPVFQADWYRVNALSTSERGSGGFGSTGA